MISFQSYRNTSEEPESRRCQSCSSVVYTYCSFTMFWTFCIWSAKDDVELSVSWCQTPPLDGRPVSWAFSVSMEQFKYHLLKKAIYHHSPIKASHIVCITVYRDIGFFFSFFFSKKMLWCLSDDTEYNRPSFSWNHSKAECVARRHVLSAEVMYKRFKEPLLCVLCV